MVGWAENRLSGVTKRLTARQSGRRVLVGNCVRAKTRFSFNLPSRLAAPRPIPRYAGNGGIPGSGCREEAIAGVFLRLTTVGGAS